MHHFANFYTTAPFLKISIFLLLIIYLFTFLFKYVISFYLSAFVLFLTVNGFSSAICYYVHLHSPSGSAFKYVNRINFIPYVLFSLFIYFLLNNISLANMLPLYRSNCTFISYFFCLKLNYISFC